MKSFTIFFLSISIIINFDLPVFSETDIEYKSMIQKNFTTQPLNIIQKSYVNTSSNEYIPENNELLKNYKLGIGDNIQINLISKELNIDLNTTLNPEGKIFIPKIGEFFTFNLSTDELKIKIKEKISKRLKDYDLSIMIYKLRSIKVNITGFINKSGSYTIPQFTRLIDFLKISEGITEQGSYRNIEILSANGIKKNYDLYNYVYQSDYNQNPILLSGDKIFIKEIDKKILITGNVLKSGIYEVKNNDNIIQNLKLSGAFYTNTSINKIIIWKRGIYNDSLNIIKTNIDELSKNNIISDGDILFVPFIKQYSDDYFVNLYGQINKSGSFQYKDGMKISDYIKSAGGPTTFADLEKVKITRNKSNKPEIIIVDINEVLFNGKKEKDIIIEPDDVIFIPEKFFIFRNFSDITSLVLSSLGIVSLVLSFIKQ
ncbi:MAG: SLBB domain-containing protein [Cyanobacteriota bacterium]